MCVCVYAAFSYPNSSHNALGISLCEMRMQRHVLERFHTDLEVKLFTGDRSPSDRNNSYRRDLLDLIADDGNSSSAFTVIHTEA